MKILICDSIDKEAISDMKNLGHEVIEKIGMKEDELKHTIKDVEVVIVRSATKLTRSVLMESENLKLIIRGGVGLDNIDIATADEKKIKVMNTPGAASISVAELTFAMMLSAVRKLVEASISTKEGKWEKKAFEGRELYQKTLGLLGFRRIGQEVAKRAVAFGMNVIAYDTIPASRIPEEIFKLPVKLVDFDTVLKTGDIISVHLPLDKTTVNLIGASEFDKMKNGVIIINCARGGIIVEKALADALNSGKVAYACVDVFSKEPIEKENPLLKAKNVILTPHLGASTHEGQQRVGKEIVNIIKNFKF